MVRLLFVLLHGWKRVKSIVLMCYYMLEYGCSMILRKRKNKTAKGVLR